MTNLDFEVNTITGEKKNLSEYIGKVLLIVNVASKCGFTKQYEDLQKLYEKYNKSGFEILGFPCNQFAEQEPGNSEEIQQFCKLNYGVSFPLFEKIEVRGENAHPLYKFLSEKIPFKGFDLSNPSAKFLSDFLKENFPQYLEGNSIKWNFTKFLIDREGNVVDRFESPIEPLNISGNIEKLL